MSVERQRAYVAEQKARDPEGWARRRAAHSLRQYRRYGDANSRVTAERARVSRRDWAARNPEKRRAHHQVQEALRAGRLVRPSECHKCGRSCNPDACQRDYARPLDVDWWCRRCHRHERSKHNIADDELIALPARVRVGSF